MGMDSFKIIIVEDVKLELKGTEEIIRTELPEAKIIGTAMNESEFWCLIKKGVPDLLLLDLGLGGSTTIGVDICRQVRLAYPELRILIFTGEILNERLWADVLKAGANGIILKTGELLTRNDVRQVMDGRNFVFNEPILEKIVSRFMKSVESERLHKDALIHYEIDEYDERFLRPRNAFRREEFGKKTKRFDFTPIRYWRKRGYQCHPFGCESITITYHRLRTFGAG